MFSQKSQRQAVRGKGSITHNSWCVFLCLNFILRGTRMSALIVVKYFSLHRESWEPPVCLKSRSLGCHSAPDLWGTWSTFWRRGFGAAREHTLVPCLDLEQITDDITDLLWWVHVVFWLRQRLWHRLWFPLIPASGQIKNLLVYFFMKCWCM